MTYPRDPSQRDPSRRDPEQGGDRYGRDPVPDGFGRDHLGRRSLNPVTWAQRRQERVREQVARARRGDHFIPTWMLLVLNLVIIAACLLGLLLT
jgi:hypothetical protein